MAYNEKHGITPRSAKRERVEGLVETFGEAAAVLQEEAKSPSHLTAAEIEEKIKECETEMRKCAKELRFEDAAHFRDLMQHYETLRILE